MPATPSPPRDVDRDARVCPKCGAPTGSADAFCASCGQNLTTVQRLPTRDEWEQESVSSRHAEAQQIADRLNTIGKRISGLFSSSPVTRRSDDPEIAKAIEQTVRTAVDGAVPRGQRWEGFVVKLSSQAVQADALRVTATVTLSDGMLLEQNFVGRLDAGKSRAAVNPDGPSRLVTSEGRQLGELFGPARQPSVPDRPPTGAALEREADDQAGLSDAARGFVSGVKRTSQSVDYEKGAPAAPLGVGLALIGAATLVVSAFLPWADVSNTGFSRLAKNTLVQHGDWFVLVAAAVICLDVYRCYTRAGRLRGLIWVLWAPVVAVVLLVAEAAQKSHFQFYPIGAGGLADTSVPATAGSPGVGLYVGIVGAVVAAAGLVAMRRIAIESLTETKRCPDCAETVLAEATVCKHCGHRFDIGGSPGMIVGENPGPVGTPACDSL
jgi:hypothetical protein